MKAILSMVRDLLEDESGASFIEYTVLLGVILAVAVTLIENLGTSATAIWQDIINKLDDLRT